ncbi:hypothetical protein CDL12_05002 [Handroanthus impetiginosus]|uniref:Uncharacterized protein n=1 Tax=Handroanthus impetiginosus TaxID=429701 RepID=A0A2G9HXN3_9LAMI|nr:hypothetical protein CDL12_05002 [Handroanthus impetiginosus]
MSRQSNLLTLELMSEINLLIFKISLIGHSYKYVNRVNGNRMNYFSHIWYSDTASPSSHPIFFLNILINFSKGSGLFHYT